MQTTLATIAHEPAALEIPLFSLPLAPTFTRSEITPYRAYLDAFTSKESKRTMENCLEIIAELLTDGQMSAEILPWHTLRTEHTQWLRARLVELYQPRTVNKHLCAVRGVLRVAENMELLTADELRRALYKFSSVKPSGELRGRMLSQLEIRSFFEACNDGTLLGVRDAAMFALLYMAGAARRSEVVALSRTDYDALTGKIQIRHGKGDKYRYDFIGEARSAVNAWLERSPDADGPLLRPVSRHGAIEMRAMTPQAVYKALQRRAVAAGIADFTPHDVRRTAISDYLDAKVDISTVAKKVGHASVAQTARYDRRDERAIERASNTLHLPYTPANGR